MSSLEAKFRPEILRSVGQWRAIIRNRMLAEMAKWDDVLYSTRFLMFAKYGQMLNVQLSFVRQDPMRMSASKKLSHRKATPRSLSLAECALRHAAYTGSLGVATLLLEKGVNIEATSDQTDGGNTVLYCAAARGDLKMTQLFLDFEANVNATASRWGRTALHGAVCSRFYKRDGCSKSFLRSQESLAVTRLLLDKGADVALRAFNHETILHRAACVGYSEVIDLLIQRGANLESRVRCETPLMIAAKKGHAEATQVLLRRGAKVDAVAPQSRATALVMAVQGCLDRSNGLGVTGSTMTAISALIHHGADINGCGGDRPPLCIASCKGCVPLVELLLEYGADVELRNAQGRTQLQLVCTEASRGEHWWVMSLLLDHEANVNTPSRDGETSLATICRNDCERPLWVRLFLVQRLVQRGADVDGRDSRGQTQS